MPTTQPTLVLTTAGVTAATSAASAGLQLTLSTFTIGSGYGYTPSTTATGLSGSLLYTGTVTSAVRQADGSVLINCTMPGQTGPFAFGEIAIYTSTGTLFGIATLPSPETKYTSLSTGVSSTFTFGILLATGTGVTSVINITGGTTPSTLQYVTSWSGVVQQDIGSASPVYTMIVSQVDNKGDYTTLVRKADGNWSIQSNYRRMSAGQLIYSVASDGSYITVAASVWTAMTANWPAITLSTVGNFSFVFQSADNEYRQATIAGTSGTAVQINFDVPVSTTGVLAGQTFTLWVNQP